MKTTKIVLVIAVSLFSYSATMAQEQVQKQEKIENKVVYTCSMHPEEISDKQGDCPKCGMKLIEKKVELKNEQIYNCSMHPEVTSDKPGKCPKCGMKLTKKGEKSNHKMGCMGM